MATAVKSVLVTQFGGYDSLVVSKNNKFIYTFYV